MKNFLLITMLMLSSLAFGSATRTLDGQQITNGAALLTLPTTTDTILGRDTTNTLTNKSMSGAANTFTLIPVGAIGNGSILSGTNTGDITISGTPHGLSLSGQALSLAAATGSVDGALLATDFVTFASKLSSALTNAHIFVGNGSGVATDVAVSGDITISNAGVVAIGAKKVVSSMIGSGAATSGQYLAADGSGGASYLSLPASAPGISGTDASPTIVTAAGGVVFSGSAYENYYFLSAASAITISATPQISAATNAGQRLVINSKSATNTITLADGNGLSLNGTWVGGLDSVLILYWNGNSTWVEISRR
jgi:hypothetical protein